MNNDLFTIFAKTISKLAFSSLLRTYILKIFSVSPTIVGPIDSRHERMSITLSVNSGSKISEMAVLRNTVFGK